MFNRNWKVAQNLGKYSPGDNSTLCNVSNYPYLQFTKINGEKILYIMAEQYGSADIITQTKILPIYLITGASNDIRNNLDTTSSNAVQNTGTINFGGGNTPPTINDYNLENEYKYATNLRQLEIVSSRTYDAETLTVKQTFKGRYVAITDMNICELGISARVRYGTKPTSSTSAAYARLLLSRDVLPEPLVVTAGQTFSVSLTIEEKLEDLGEEVTSVSAEIE